MEDKPEGVQTTATVNLQTGRLYLQYQPLSKQTD